MSDKDDNEHHQSMDINSDMSEVQFFIDQVSEKYLTKIKEDRLQSDQKQIREMSLLLKDWTDKILSTTKDILGTIQSSGASDTANPLDGIVDDIRDRQTKMALTIQDAHSRQMDMLKAAISEERKESAQAQLLFEQTLKTRYECMVDALHEKIRAEQEARMQRALDNLERSARVESERAKQSFDIQQEAEFTLSKKFKSIVSDLRRSWEEEEIGRALQLEERLRSHYSVVLEHMEAQLKMALTLQDDADKQWLEDVEGRNKQQLETLRAFEEKCKRLYDTRLTEFADKTSRQMGEYEEQLLQSGKALAAEKVQFESRLRRVKLACSRWKVAYQRDIHERYQEMTGSLEERYMSEIDQLLQEISVANAQLAESGQAVDLREKELLKMRELSATESDESSGQTPVAIREDLVGRWNELKVPVSERIDALILLLDASKITPQMQSVYEALNNKLSARFPIAQLVNRKQYIEYKLKLASRIGGEGSNLTASDRAQLITELTENQSSTEQLVRQYERKFGESYFKGVSPQVQSNSLGITAAQDSSSMSAVSGVSPVGMSAVKSFAQQASSLSASPIRPVPTVSSFRSPQPATNRKPLI